MTVSQDHKAKARKSSETKDTTTQKEQQEKKGGMQQETKICEPLNEKKKKKSKKSIIRTAPVIHLSSHNHHPDQKHETDNPESKCRVPLRTYRVLLQPSQSIDRDATNIIVVDVAVAVGGYIALIASVSLILSKKDRI